MINVAEKLVEDYLKQYNINRKYVYLIYSIGLEEEIKTEIEKLIYKKGFEKIMWIQAGATISTHAGPGCFGIAGIENE